MPQATPPHQDASHSPISCASAASFSRLGPNCLMTRPHPEWTICLRSMSREEVLGPFQRWPRRGSPQGAIYKQERIPFWRPHCRTSRGKNGRSPFHALRETHKKSLCHAQRQMDRFSHRTADADLNGYRLILRRRHVLLRKCRGSEKGQFFHEKSDRRAPEYGNGLIDYVQGFVKRQKEALRLHSYREKEKIERQFEQDAKPVEDTAEVPTDDDLKPVPTKLLKRKEKAAPRPRKNQAAKTTANSDEDLIQFVEIHHLPVRELLVVVFDSQESRGLAQPESQEDPKITIIHECFSEDYEEDDDDECMNVDVESESDNYLSVCRVIEVDDG
ncbi:hypothetical protein QAD02_008709 [Eretmocerus hayati]|uniref:Uncharacterized protein n=1 Tax=Eretmocerus hayati TaxID=131215 RepID=A0ACC2N9M6_9HYME|nr:hypothetical protein QAD02_008709 [Eretmocerus hayati]